MAELSDQSILVTKLPSLNTNSSIDDSFSRKEYIKKQNRFFYDVFEMATDDIEKIVKTFEDRGFAYMGSRQISFFCPCSKDRMILNLRGLYGADQDDLFDGNNMVEIKCDYCRNIYNISKSEVLGT